MSGFLGAFQFLTRVPVRLARPPELARCVPWFPVVGALVGAVAGGVAASLFDAVGPAVAAGCAVAVALLVTGAFHEDGLADVADSLPENPLPDAFVVEPREATPQTLERLREELRGWPNVAHVELDALWARRLEAGLGLARLAVWLLAALLAFALIAVTFNTIRLQILTRREEIEVAKLIGATDPFIRRPLVVHECEGTASQPESPPLFEKLPIKCP